MSQTQDENASPVENNATRERKDSEDGEYSPEVYFKPIIELPLVDTKTHEEEEEELIKLRARLYRYETSDEGNEWKERGTGEVKILKHKTRSSIRLVMRRDKTLKICANHYGELTIKQNDENFVLNAVNYLHNIKSNMELRKHMSNEKAWIWNTIADFADEQPRAELLCIRFANVENAQKFYDAFEEAKQLAKTYEQTNGDLSDILTKVKLNDEGDENEQKHDSEDEKESEESETSGNETKEDQK